MHKNFGNPWSHFPEKHRFVSFWAILGHFGTVWPKIRETGFFGRNRALSLSSLYQVVTCCQVSEKSSEPFSRKWPTQLPNYPTIPAWAHLLEVRTTITGVIIWDLCASAGPIIHGSVLHWSRPTQGYQASINYTYRMSNKLYESII